MNGILKFIWEWKFIIMILAMILLFCLLEWQRAKALLFALMLQAKRMAKDALLNSGQEQEEWVVNKAMLVLPLYLRVLIGENLVRMLVRFLFSKLRDYADDGIINNSINMN